MSSLRTIRVLLVDDHDILRNGLMTVFEIFDDLEIIGEAVNGQQAVDLCLKLHPDVILLDLVMPQMDGVTAANLIRQQMPEIKIVALTSYEDGKLIESAQKAGFNGYLLKNVSMDELAKAIRDAYDGKEGSFPEDPHPG